MEVQLQNERLAIWHVMLTSRFRATPVCCLVSVRSFQTIDFVCGLFTAALDRGRYWFELCFSWTAHIYLFLWSYRSTSSQGLGASFQVWSFILGWPWLCVLKLVGDLDLGGGPESWSLEAVGCTAGVTAVALVELMKSPFPF